MIKNKLTPSLPGKGFYISFFTKNNYLNTKLLVWLILIYFPIFLNLGGLVMHRWDEGRYGVSSYEMLHGGNPFVVTYLNEPSMGSAKPPLMHWLQAISIWLFGFDETSVRLPSAFAGLFMCIAIMYVCLKKLNSFSLGFIITMILINARDMFCGIDHCVRTGDYDALLMLFSLLAIFSFYQYNEYPGQHKWLFRTFVFITLAVLTKAVAGLFYGPGMLLYLIFKGNLIKTIKNKWLYYSLGFFVVVCAFIFLIREHYTPGYLQALNDNELFGRHNIAMDGHVGDFWYYLDDIRPRFDPVFWMIPLGWLLGLASENKTVRSLSLLTLTLSISFYVVISSAKSKLYWYAFPLYPLLAMQAGIFMWCILKKISYYISGIFLANRHVFLYLSIVLIFIIPYVTTVQKVDHRDFPESIYRWNNIELYCKLEKPVIKNGIMLAHPNDFQIPYRFYFLKLNERGFNLKYEVGYSSYKPGDVLIIEDPEYQRAIEAKYNVETLDQYYHLKVFKILSSKT